MKIPKQKKRVKVSIITVCYNSKITISETIESVVAQDYERIEYIIVDGGSSDGTLDIITEYGEAIHHIISEPDKGIYDAMNKGLKIATGDVVGILNSDDVFNSPYEVSKIAEFFNNENKCDAVYSDLVYVQRDDIDTIVRYYDTRTFKKWKMRFGIMIPHPTFYAKKELFEKYGYYKCNYRVAADFELLARMISKNITIKRLPTVMVRMRMGGISSTGFFWILHQNKEILRACKENYIYTNVLFLLFKLPYKLGSYVMKKKRIKLG